MIRVIGKTKNDINIYMSFVSDKHMEAHPIPDAVLKEAISKIEYHDHFELFEVKFDRVIGKCSLVKVDEHDTVEYYRRKGRFGETPFVKKDPIDTDSIVVGICNSFTNLELPTIFTAFYGNKSLPEPWDRNIKTEEDRRASEKFWSEHALCYDESIIA